MTHPPRRSSVWSTSLLRPSTLSAVRRCWLHRHVCHKTLRVINMVKPLPQSSQGRREAVVFDPPNRAAGPPCGLDARSPDSHLLATCIHLPRFILSGMLKPHRRHDREQSVASSLHRIDRFRNNSPNKCNMTPCPRIVVVPGSHDKLP